MPPPDVGASLRIAIVDCLVATATAAAAEDDDDIATVSGNRWMAGIDDPEWFISASMIGIDRDVIDIGCDHRWIEPTMLLKNG
jgi:hypothetical protein